MGFGHGPFGSGRFGRADWPVAVLDSNVPEQMTADDVAAEGVFQKILNTTHDSFEFLRQRAEAMPNLRRPLDVASRFTKTESVVVESTSKITRLDDDYELWGNHVQLVCEDPPVDIGAGWVAEKDGLAYRVLRVRKQENRVDVAGTLDPGTGEITFSAPEQISALYKDFGLDPDRYYDDRFLRLELENAVQWLNRKGLDKGYVFRALCAGFDVTVYPLWAIDLTEWLGIVEYSDAFQYPSGSGDWLTWMSPTFPTYDDIAADVIEADHLYADVEDELVFAAEIVAVTLSPDAPYDQFSEHEIELAAEFTAMGLPDLWQVTDSAGTRFAIESRVDGTHMIVGGMIAPVVGACTFKVRGRVYENELWSKTHYLKLVIAARDELLASFPGDSGDATARLIAKLNEVKPAHVVFASIIETHESVIDIDATVDQRIREVNAGAPAGVLRYDDVPADEFGTDDDPPFVTNES